jgi:SH3-like domain-containing protein
MITAGLLSIALIGSLLVEGLSKHRASPGVILSTEVVARKGDGEMYELAFLDPLHAGTEFQRLEVRGTWWHIRLANGQACWIPARAAEVIALD